MMDQEELVPKYHKFYKSIMIHAGEPKARMMILSKLELIANDPQIVPEDKKAELLAVTMAGVNLNLIGSTESPNQDLSVSEPPSLKRK